MNEYDFHQIEEQISNIQNGKSDIPQFNQP